VNTSKFRLDVDGLVARSRNEAVELCHQIFSPGRFETGSEKQVAFVLGLCMRHVLSSESSVADLSDAHLWPHEYYAAPSARVARPILLIHVAKTGGESVGKTLGIQVPQDDPYMFPGPWSGPGTDACQGVPVVNTRHKKHDRAIEAMAYYTEEEWQHAFKITFVRNPWEREVSMWAMKMTDVVAQATPAGARAFGYAENMTQCGCTNSLQPHLAPRLPEDVVEAEFPCSYAFWLDHCPESPDHFRITEHSFLVDENGLDPDHVLVDFAGRTENMQKHLELALLAAGNNETLSAACAASLLHNDHGSSHGPYADYYSSTHSIEMPYFNVDAAAFNYTFNVSGPMNVIFPLEALPVERTRFAALSTPGPSRVNVMTAPSQSRHDAHPVIDVWRRYLPRINYVLAGIGPTRSPSPTDARL